MGLVDKRQRLVNLSLQIAERHNRRIPFIHSNDNLSRLLWPVSTLQSDRLAQATFDAITHDGRPGAARNDKRKTRTLVQIDVGPQ